jgi:hypothetical protein
MKYTPAVVTDIVLDENSTYFNTVGGYNGIGTVVYREINNNKYGALGFAKSYFPNFSNYPLKNELIYIIKLPNPDTQNNVNRESAYYIAPINVWNSPHHNAIPNIFNNTDIPDSQKQDYQQTELGSVRRVSDGSTDIDLGNTFTEQSNIKPLTKYEGDVILEGRFGNSLRFGSTVVSGSFYNNWSKDGINGDPITIIRNGQPTNAGSVGFLPIEENINRDPSSIYLTTTQKLPELDGFIRSSYDSYSTPPTSPSQYNKPQVILKSGRLLFATDNDHILFSSKKSINLNAYESINLDTPGDVILESSKVYLGSKDATEQVVLGNTLKTQLDTLITALNTFASICSAQISQPSGVQLAAIVSAADTLKNALGKVNTSNILSDDIYTV